MKEHKEINESEDTQTVAIQLVEINKRLVAIEKSLEQIQTESKFQWNYSIGFGGMAVGAGLVTAGASLSDTSLVLSGALVFLLGIATMLTAPMILRKSRKKSDEKGVKEQ